MIEIRKLSGKEKEKAVQAACDVFFDEQDIPKEMTVIKDELSPIWWGAFSGEELVGTVAAYKENNEQHMGRLTVTQSARGNGLATKLVKTALTELFNEGASEVFLDAREATKRIILHLGGEVIGEEYPFFKSTCVPVKITKEEFQNGHE